MTDLEALDLKANPGAFSTFDAAVLVPEVEKLKPDQVYLEVGVDKGKSLSIARMVAKKGVHVFGVDLREDPKIPETIFIQNDSVKVAQWWGTVTAMVNIPKTEEKIDVLFIDADHTYEGCKADIDAWYPHMAEHGVMLFHDCDATSPGVVQAVKEFAEEHKLDVYYDPNPRCSMARIYL